MIIANNNKNCGYDVDQSIPAENESQQVYPTIKLIRKILITNLSYVDFTKLRHNILAPSCFSNC